MPKVSIVIPTYNAGKYLIETLDSIFRQSFDDFEIVLIDDCSTDDTEVKVRGVEDDRVRYMKLEANHGGPSYPRNVGVGKARGEYIAFFDSDDLMLEGKLARSVSFLDREQGVSLVFTDALKINDIGELMPGTLLSRYSDMRRCLIETGQQGEYMMRSEDAFRCLFFENYIPTSSVVVRKALLNKFGQFDDDLLNGDDRDMWFRVARNSDIGFIDYPLHKYRVREGSVSNRGVLTAQNRIRVLEKQIASGLPKDLEVQAHRLIAKNYYGIGYAFRRQGDLRKARNYYAKSLKHDLKSTVLRSFLATFAGYKILSLMRPE